MTVMCCDYAPVYGELQFITDLGHILLILMPGGNNDNELTMLSTELWGH